jgi:hypothetical protein
MTPGSKVETEIKKAEPARQSHGIVDAESREKAIHQPESQRSTIPSNQSNRVQPRSLIKEALKELDHEL